MSAFAADEYAVYTMSTHKIQVHLIVLTQKNKRLFLRWALRGFRRRELGPVKASEKRTRADLLGRFMSFRSA
jgi:hypothetical protein